MRSNHFTVDRQFFLSNPSIDLWRFEVVFSFPTATSLSALDFLINRPPSNGSYNINSLLCFLSDWFDDDGIKDYYLLVPSSRGSMIAFSFVPNFGVYFPPSDDLRLMILIRDQRDCLTEWTNLSPLIIEVESNAFDDLLYSWNGQFSTSNPFLQLLSIPNQNRVGQILSSLSLNKSIEPINRI